MADPVLLTPSLADNTGYLLHRAAVRARESALSGNGRHPREFAVLTGLISVGPCSQRQLADHLRLNPTVMVQVIDALERDGLVERARNPDDRRSYALQPTPAGLNAIAEMDEDAASADAALVERLSKVDQARLNLLLRELIGPAQQRLPAALTARTGVLVIPVHRRARALGAAALDPLGIPVRYLGTLSAIGDAGGGLSQQDLARWLGVSGPVVAQMVDDLEARGLIARRGNPRDRRSYQLALTARGRTMRRKGAAVQLAAGAELTAPLGVERAAELRRLLRKLIGAAEPDG